MTSALSRICGECKESVPTNVEGLMEIGMKEEVAKALDMKKGKGCKTCGEETYIRSPWTMGLAWKLPISPNCTMHLGCSFAALPMLMIPSAQAYSRAPAGSAGAWDAQGPIRPFGASG